MKMPDLGPQTKNKVGLRDDWYIPVSNPVDPKDNGLCIQITQGPFNHVVIKYNNFKMVDEENSDGSLDCNYSYDIVLAPADIGEREISDLEGEKFEKLLGEIILEILQEQINENETRDNNTKKSDI
tara:strand:+ start:671 stop:1048 length:378 start_codon:yes stop_codon:yes gene_type:complete